MADNQTLTKAGGGSFIARMKEFAGAIYSSVPLIGDPSTGDPLALGRAAEAASLPFAPDDETFALFTSLNSNMALLAGALAGIGITATAASPDYSEGAENQPLSGNLFGGLRAILQDPATGDDLDLSLAQPIYFDVLGPQAPRLPMATNTNAQTLLAAGGSGVFYDLVGWKAYNPAGGATVIVSIIDDAAGANVTVDEMVLAAGAQDASGCVNVPTRQLVANKAWSAKLSGSVAGVIVKAWFTTRTA